MSYTDYRAKFTLKDGRVLTCEHTVGFSPGGPWEPPSSECSRPEYCFDGEPIEYDDLPKSLHVIAARMYDCTNSEYWRRHFVIEDVTKERIYEC